MKHRKNIEQKHTTLNTITKPNHSVRCNKEC